MSNQTTLFTETIFLAKETRAKRQAKVDRTPELVEAARGFEKAIGEIDDLIWEIQGSYDALKRDFYAARDALLWEWHSSVERTGSYAMFDHSEAAKAKRKPLYEVLRLAGMAWRPVRTSYDDLVRARKAIVLELKCINAELDR